MRNVNSNVVERTKSRRPRFIWDTITIGTTPDARYDLYTDNGGKTKSETNLTQNGLLPTRQSALIRGISITFNPAAAIADIQKIAYEGIFSFLTDDSTIRVEGPVAEFSSGKGIYTYGSPAVGGNDSAVNGVIPFRLGNGETITIDNGRNFRGLIEFSRNLTLSAATEVRVILDTLLKKPVS